MELGADLRQLAQLAGVWRGAEAHAASPWAAAGTADAELDFRVVAGGVALAQDYTARRDGATVLSGHGVFSIDPDDGAVLWHWFDSVGRHPPRVPGRGTWHGEQLVVERSSPRGTNRTTLTRHGDRLEQTIAFARPQSSFTQLVRGAYARQS